MPPSESLTKCYNRFFCAQTVIAQRCTVTAGCNGRAGLDPSLLSPWASDNGEPLYAAPAPALAWGAVFIAVKFEVPVPLAPKTLSSH